MLEHEIEPSACTPVPGVRAKVVKYKLHAGTLDYVSGGIHEGSVEGLFILDLLPVSSNHVSEKMHLSAYCYSCLIGWRLLPSVS